MKVRTPLYEIAATLGNIHFPDDDREIEIEFQNRTRDLELWKNVRAPSPHFKSRNKPWLVRIGLGGKQRCIGATKRGADAARFSDMATVRFSKYQRHHRAELKFNFSAEQARVDEVECPAAAELLDTIEKYFLDNGIIQLPDDREKKSERKSRGLKSDILVLHEEVMGAFSAVVEKLELLKRSVEAMSKDIEILKCSRILRGAVDLASDNPVVFRNPIFSPDPIPGPGQAPSFTCKNNVDSTQC